MKSMKTKVAAIVLVLALALTGCMNEEINIVVNSDGSGSVEVIASVDKQAMIDATNSMSGSTKLSESDIKDLDSSMIQQGYKLVTIDGKEYYQMTEKQTIQKGDLQKSFGGEADSYVTTDTVYLVIPAGGDDVAQMQQEASAYGATITADSIKITATVQMPAAIVSTNGTIDSSNPNKASFNVPIDKDSVIFATTKSGVTTSSVKTTIDKLNAVNAPKIKKLKANKVKAKAKKASVTLKIKKVKGTKKYEIEYSTKKNFKKAASVSTKKTTYTIKKLKKGKKYYVRVRAAKTNYADVTVYSKWVKKSVKTKK